MRQLTLAIFSLFLAFALTLQAQAQDHGHRMGEMNQEQMMQMMHRMMQDESHRAMMLPCLASELADELDLSTVQQQRLAALQAESRNRMQGMNREGMRAMDRQNMQEMNMQGMMAKHHANVRGILRPEQLQRLNDLEMPAVRAAMMARMNSQEGGMMNCPMMEHMMDGQMMDHQMMNDSDPEPEEHRH